MRISPKDIFQAGNDIARPLDGFLAFAYQFQQAPLFLLGHFDQRWRTIELHYVVPVNFMDDPTHPPEITNAAKRI